MKLQSMLQTAIAYGFWYDFSRVYFYYAGYFCYAKSYMQSINMGALQRIPSIATY
jgi:hypothetical protein